IIVSYSRVNSFSSMLHAAGSFVFLFLTCWVVTFVTQVSIAICFFIHIIPAQVTFFLWQISKKLNDTFHCYHPFNFLIIILYYNSMIDVNLVLRQNLKKRCFYEGNNYWFLWWIPCCMRGYVCLSCRRKRF